MDYKKNYFDDLVENDNKGNFLLVSTTKCINKCIPNVVAGDLTGDEKNCFLDCYSKMYLTYSMTNNILQLNK
jgi:hypothetical protein